MIFTDCGHAFKDKQGLDLLEHNGFVHVTYPPCVHHWLSPNDNHFHGVAKAQWRAKIDPVGGGTARSDITLLQALGAVPVSMIKEFFVGNFCLAAESTPLYYVGRFSIRTHNAKDDELEDLHQLCIQTYTTRRDDVVLGDHIVLQASFDQANRGLDGPYWKKFDVSMKRRCPCLVQDGQPEKKRTRKS